MAVAVVAAAPHLQCQLALMQSSSHMVALVMSAWIIWATRALVKDFLGGAGMFMNVCASFHGEHDELHRLDCEKFSVCAFFRQPCV